MLEKIIQVQVDCSDFTLELLTRGAIIHSTAFVIQVWGFEKFPRTIEKNII
jgi:hypothetical protein